MWYPVTSGRGGAQPLLATVEAYLSSSGNTTRTAQLLHLSVRGVIYRLHRIATLSACTSATRPPATSLHTAVLGARALGRPDNRDHCRVSALNFAICGRK